VTSANASHSSSKKRIAYFPSRISIYLRYTHPMMTASYIQKTYISTEENNFLRIREQGHTERNHAKRNINVPLNGIKFKIAFYRVIRTRTSLIVSRYLIPDIRSIHESSCIFKVTWIIINDIVSVIFITILSRV